MRRAFCHVEVVEGPNRHRSVDRLLTLGGACFGILPCVLSIRRWQILNNYYCFALSKLRGESYTEFYARKKDRTARQFPALATGTPEAKAYQLPFLIEHGLRPESSLLDYGCGTLAAGVAFIRYLQPGRYMGADISAGCLEVGRRRIAEGGLEAQGAQLVHLPGGSLAPLAGRRFDIIWAQSVFTHMPPDTFCATLRGLQAFMHEDTRFYATFFAQPSGGARRAGLVAWFYDQATIEDVVRAAGMVCEPVPEWRHPTDPNGDFDRLLRFSVSP
jgi:SAM-dependent methyltransferase